MPDQPQPATSTTIHPPAVESFRCDGCGLCCRHLLVGADWSDVLREPRIAQECPNHGAKAPILEQCWILFSAKHNACPFLGDDQKCGIYPTRPSSCVAFAAGSTKCQELRIEAGLRPLTAVAAQHLLDQINAAELEYDQENDE